tara:strand:+ start:470 stop:682 length:213 start_codon:yes stop_codon:yes gene_type:complete
MLKNNILIVRRNKMEFLQFVKNIEPALLVVNTIMSLGIFCVTGWKRGFKDELTAAYGYAFLAWSICIGLI